jgi:hypothetical protein
MPQAEFKVKKVEHHVVHPQAQPNADGSVPAIYLLPFTSARVYAERVVDGMANAGAIALDGDPLEFWGFLGIAEGDVLVVEIATQKGDPPNEMASLRAQLDMVRAELDAARAQVGAVEVVRPLVD